MPSLAAEADATQNEPQQTPGVRSNRPILRTGSQGTEVSELQAALKLLGYYAGKVDGIYSESTADAVSRFQQSAGLKPDGVVGYDTWNRLFPATATTTRNPSTSSPSNSAASFPVPAATRATSTNSKPQATTAAAPRTTTNRQTSTAAAPRTTYTRQTTTTTPSRTTTNRQQTSTASVPRTTNTRQTTTTTAPRKTYNRQTTTAAAPRSYNTQPTRRYTSQAQTENSSSQSNLPILRLGAQGSSVVQLQRRLRNLGFYKGKVNGVFDEATLGGVQAAQQRFQLEPDGVVGPATWSVLLR